MTWLDLFTKLKHNNKFEPLSRDGFKTGDLVEFTHPSGRIGKHVGFILRADHEILRVFPVVYRGMVFSFYALPQELSKLDWKEFYDKETGIEPHELEYAINHYC